MTSTPDRRPASSPAATPDFDVVALRSRLLAWYEAHARDLPWRRDPRPYPVWISEVMLQQTQVETVIPYFERWLERFPDIQTLADSEIDDVLSQWSGLGYYRRAHHIHAAANRIVDAHDGEVPADHDALLELPGVGPYTAGAIASIAFDLPRPVVDGNVARVLTRIAEIEGDPSRNPVKSRLWALAGELVDGPRPSELNQALMELGALVCRPSAPACAMCPVDELCSARAHGCQHELPTPKPRRKRHRLVAAGLLISVSRPGCAPAHVLVRRDTDLLSGLWYVPTLELLHVRGRRRDPDTPAQLPDDALGSSARSRVHGLATSLLGDLAPSDPTAVRPLPPIDHLFTHIDYTLVPWRLKLDNSTVESLAERLDRAIAARDGFDAWRVVERKELSDIGIPRVIGKLFERL